MENRIPAGSTRQTKITKGHIHIKPKEIVPKENKQLFEDFIKNLKIAGEKINAIYPQYLMISLNGGLPLYECLKLVDREISNRLDDTNNVVYFPASSKIFDSKQVIKNCFENFLNEKLDESDARRRIVSLDEVISGGSVGRLLNGYHYASRQMAKRNLRKGSKEATQEAIDKEAYEIRERMPYTIIGLREMRSNSSVGPEYKKYVEAGTIIEIPTAKILTLDNPDVQILDWDHPNSSGYVGDKFWPRIKGFTVKDSYLDFLKSVAAYVGVDPETVGCPKNLEKIRADCAKYSKKPKY